MDRFKEISGEYKWMIIGIPCLSLLLPLVFKLDDLKDATFEYYLTGVGFTFIHASLIWGGNTALYSFVSRKLPDYEQTRKRIIYLAVFTTLYTFLITLLISSIIQPITCGEFTWWRYLEDFRFSFTVTIIVSSMYEINHFFKKWKGAIIESERLQKQNIISQYETLKNQVNPHFLFNCLNALSSLIHIDVHKAERFIDEFSKVYRYLLEVMDKTVVTIKEELSFINSYIFLQKIRFGENLNVEINIDAEELNSYIPPVGMQLLIENAIKHNIVSKNMPLNVQILSKNGFIEIINNLQKREEKGKSTGVGLKNLKAKYMIISEIEPQFLVKDGNYIARIPIIKEEE